MKAPYIVFITALALVLTACSGGHPAPPAPAIEVSGALPTRQTFHSYAEAFGQLAADSRSALSLSLPQAGQVVATDVVAGRQVQQGTALLQLTTDPATRNAYLQAQAAAKVAAGNLTRTKKLHAEKLATNAQVDDAQKALADARTALKAQAELGGAQSVVTLRAPADGVVTTLAVQRGQRVAPGVTLIRFAPTSALAAQLGVDPAAGSAIHPGMVALLSPVYATSNVHSLRATVAMVSAAVDPKTHLINLVATLNHPVQLAAGTALVGRVETSNFQAWSVPRDALQRDARGAFVYQVEQGKAKRINVKVLSPNGNPIGIVGAVDPRAPVITLGSYEVSEGEGVNVTLPSKTPATGAKAAG